MLDKKVFQDGINRLLVCFPNWKFRHDDAFTLKVWYEKLCHMDNERYMYMINEYVSNNNFNPTIKGLLENDTIRRKSRDQIKHEKMLKEMGWFDDRT